MAYLTIKQIREQHSTAEVLAGNKTIGQVVSKGPAFDIVASNYSMLTQAK